VELFRNRGLTDDERARLPPGQHVVNDFPVLHAGSVPYPAPPPGWDFRVFGAVERPRGWSLDELRALPTRTVTADIHCVTTWSKLDTVWEDVAVWPLLEELGVRPEATHAVAHSEEGWERLGYSNTADPWKEERYGF
jgi:DMSO/TMAO reductase YedYZ molybdopterin-dependent catalytic subunit